MHLLERYSLSCGAKIGNPFILDRFFPLTVDKYITLQPNSKYSSKCYDFWQDVVDMIQPTLRAQNIHIVQIGTPEDKPLRGCYITSGQTNLGQVAYIIRGSILHLGADSFAAHMASAMGKKVVSLYSNNYAEVVKPYWGEGHILLEPPRDEKPSFSANENPKSINLIKPEEIANSLFKALGIDRKELSVTEYVGKNYVNRIIETVPNQVVTAQDFKVDSLIVRMDFLFDENCLVELLQRGRCCVVTDKPISRQILEGLRPHIKEIVYDLKESNDPSFAQTLQECNLPYFLVTDLQGDALNNLKLAYLDYGLITEKPHPSEETINKLKQKLSSKEHLWYKTNKITLSNGKLYPSKAAWLANKPIASLRDTESQVINNTEFWKELECFRIFSTTK